MKNVYFRCMLWLCLAGIGLVQVMAQAPMWQSLGAATDGLDNRVQIDLTALRASLADAPAETAARRLPLTLMLPLPGGQPLATSVVRAPIMHPSLAQRYGISSYSGRSAQGYVRMSLTPEGLHAFILGHDGTIAIEPVPGEAGVHRVYHSQAEADPAAALARCGTDMGELTHQHGRYERRSGTIGGELRDYRLALATSAEYSQFHGGSLSSVMSALATAMTYINGVLERDVAIRLTMIANNDAIIFFDPNTDPYTYNALGTNLNENQNALASIIGLGNFDIGHVFTQVTPPPGGSYTAGIAQLGSVCNSGGKARGASSQPSPIGESFFQIALHEIGHQFVAGHSWNANAGSCTGGQYSPQTAWEPGSGSTIMSYVGVCGPHNITTQRDGYFHGGNIEQMFTFSRSGNGNCATTIPLGNQAPVITMPENGKTIPFLTPFALTGEATDPDGDALRYCWEQFDLGPAGDPRAPINNAPMFRSFLPRESPTRYFPRLPNLLNNTTILGEYIPDYRRDMTFRLTVRDEHPGGGGVEWGEVSLSVTDQAGPFVVSTPNANTDRWVVGGLQTVRWDVASTNQPPVNCREVDVLLSVDGGLTYPYVLAQATPNDGSVEVVVPDTASVQARVMVRAADNYFLDVSNENFVLEPAAQADFELYTPEQANRICAGGLLEIPLLVQAQGGFAQTVDLVSQTLPAGMTASLSNASAMPGDTVLLSIDVPAGTPRDRYTCAVLGTSVGGTFDQRTIAFEVAESSSGEMLLETPLAGTRGVSRRPTLSWASLPGTERYQLEVAATPSFAAPLLTQRDLATTRYQITDELAGATPYYWRVLAIDACGDTVYSPTYAFQTGACRRAVAVDLPQNIPALGAPHELTSRVVMTLNGTVADVNVRNLQGEHRSVRDLRASLISPAGTEALLMSRPCTDGTENFRLGFDDEAESGDLPCPPTTGLSYQPEDALSVFDGEQAQGQWRLELTDFFDFDGGDWYNWELEVCTELAAGPTLVRNEPLSLSVGTLAIIDTQLLRSIDPGASAEDLTYTVVAAPRHGLLRRNNTFLLPGGTFTQDFIDKRLLLYQHSGDQVRVDSFSFAVENADGGWVGLYTFHINVEGVSSLRATDQLAVEVFPVPARTHLQVRLPQANRMPTHLSLYDGQGKALRRATLPQGQTAYDWLVADLPAGFYWLRVQQGYRARSFPLMLID